ncbi:cyclic nucleotide-binding domain-containing protein [Streptococcus sp. zg-JUN1979]|uniref:cyclic nucleotide-binding domain-containing protein n=1 Tax=Streptococcus sp. zg-JUN1979 TaxID=3391450 RepID=UPI0039A55C49
MSQLTPDLTSLIPKHYQKHLKILDIPAGERICQQGDNLEYLTYILSGKVTIMRQLFNGREHILDTREGYCLIGDIEFLTKQKILASVIALEECRIAQLPLLKLSETLLEDASFLRSISQGLAQTLYNQNIRAATNIIYSLKERLASHILEVHENGVFRLEISRLADSFGVSYRHLSRVLKQLVLDGVLDKQKPYYTIKDYAALEKLKITN